MPKFRGKYVNSAMKPPSHVDTVAGGGKPFLIMKHPSRVSSQRDRF